MSKWRSKGLYVEIPFHVLWTSSHWTPAVNTLMDMDCSLEVINRIQTQCGPLNQKQ